MGEGAQSGNRCSTESGVRGEGLWNLNQGNVRVLSSGGALSCSDWPDLYLSSGHLLRRGVGVMSVAWVLGYPHRGGDTALGVSAVGSVSILGVLDPNRGSARIQRADEALVYSG